MIKLRKKNSYSGTKTNTAPTSAIITYPPIGTPLVGRRPIKTTPVHQTYFEDLCFHFSCIVTQKIYKFKRIQPLLSYIFIFLISTRWTAHSSKARFFYNYYTQQLPI